MVSLLSEERGPVAARLGRVLIALDGPAAGLSSGALLELSPEPGFSYALRVTCPADTPVVARRVRPDGGLGARVPRAALALSWRALGHGLLPGCLELELSPELLGAGPICLGLGARAPTGRSGAPRRLRVSFPEYPPAASSQAWVLGSVEIRREPLGGVVEPAAGRPRPWPLSTAASAERGGAPEMKTAR